MKQRFTQNGKESVKSVKITGKGYWITDEGVLNLRLYVGAKGIKTWYVGYRKEPTSAYQNHKLGSADVLTVAEARETAKIFLARLALGEDPTKKKEKTKQALLLGDFINNTYSPWRLSIYKAATKTLGMMQSQFGNTFYSRPINELKVADFYAWCSIRLEQGRKATTVNKNIVALKAALRWGVKHGYIDSNPLEKLELLKEYDSATKVRYLSSEERKSLFAALSAREETIRAGRDSHNEWLKERGERILPNLKESAFIDHLKPMVIVSLNTGIRRGSLFQLLWSDINFQESNLTIRSTSEKTGKLVHIPMSPTLKKTLQAWKDQTNGNGDNLVFPSPVTGNVMNNCKKAWASVLKAADIRDFRWHDMRHDFASQLVMRGVDLNIVRELLGHSDLKMTLRYAHLAPENKMRAVELLDNEMEG